MRAGRDVGAKADEKSVRELTGRWCEGHDEKFGAKVDGKSVRGRRKVGAARTAGVLEMFLCCVEASKTLKRHRHELSKYHGARIPS